MAQLMVDLTYGSALFQAATETGRTALITEEADALLGILDEAPDLLELLNTPAIAAVTKKEVITSIFEGHICDELLNFLCILIDKGRTRHFAKIIGTYKEMLNKAEGFSSGKILSVEPLSEGRLKRFEEETGKLLKLNVKLENLLAPDLIGGVKVFIDGKVIDASIKSRLKDLGASLKQ